MEDIATTKNKRSIFCKKKRAFRPIVVLFQHFPVAVAVDCDGDEADQWENEGEIHRRHTEQFAFVDDDTLQEWH